MPPIFWLETADADLAAITDYIRGTQHQRRRKHVAQAALLRITAIGTPTCSSSDRAPRGLREIVAHPTIVMYRVAAGRIEIVNVVHTRQQFPRSPHE